MEKKKEILTNKIEFIAATPSNPRFYADTGHWYLLTGIVGINNIRLIACEKELPDQENQ